MISKSQKRKFLKFLPTNWVEEVLKLSEAREIKNPRTGNLYSEGYIRMILEGKRENLEIETLIMEVYECEKTKIQRHETKKENLLAS